MRLACASDRVKMWGPFFALSLETAGAPFGILIPEGVEQIRCDFDCQRKHVMADVSLQ